MKVQVLHDPRLAARAGPRGQLQRPRKNGTLTHGRGAVVVCRSPRDEQTAGVGSKATRRTDGGRSRARRDLPAVAMTQGDGTRAIRLRSRARSLRWRAWRSLAREDGPADATPRAFELLVRRHDERSGAAAGADLDCIVAAHGRRRPHPSHLGVPHMPEGTAPIGETDHGSQLSSMIGSSSKRAGRRRMRPGVSQELKAIDASARSPFCIFRSFSPVLCSLPASSRTLRKTSGMRGARRFDANGCSGCPIRARPLRFGRGERALSLTQRRANSPIILQPR